MSRYSFKCGYCKKYYYKGNYYFKEKNIKYSNYYFCDNYCLEKYKIIKRIIYYKQKSNEIEKLINYLENKK